MRIALDHGLNWRDVARWNGIENPNLIEVGQVLKVSPPLGDTSVAETKPVPAPGRVESRPLPGAGVPVAAPASASATASPIATAAVTPTTAPSPAPLSGPVPTSTTSAPEAAPRETSDGIEWAWPALGPVLASFDDVRGVKGVALGGRQGDAVLAAADGRVIYAGAGLRGYGNLIIVRHNSNFLSAYAHNHALLVKEDQAVRKGQRIADMGASDADRVKLHFEIRRKGVPVDPTRFLPPR